jgi:steroid delta-isomerase-like uncharacterized protein
MSTEENKDLVRRFLELVNQKDLDALEEFSAPDLVWHLPGRDIQGFEHAKRVEGTYLNAFPDVNFAAVDMIAEGNKVVTRFTFRGTHRGETEELGPPSGRQVELEAIYIHRIEGGRIVEFWEMYDNLSFLQQLGLVPEQ